MHGTNSSVAVPTSATQPDKIDQWPLQAGTRWALVARHAILDVQALHGHLERCGNGDRDQRAQDAKGDKALAGLVGM
jgi:hypothetical protein